jgi:apolipoprotein N-acyltransferase
MFMGMGWMWFLTAPGYVVAASTFAALHAVAAAVAPSGTWRTFGRPAAHTLAEIVRLSFPFGGVPLATLGISQASGPLLPVARVGGVILLSWVVFQIGFALSAWIGSLLTDVHPEVPRPAALGFLLAVFAVTLALVAPAGTEVEGASLDVAAVQGGGEQGTTALDVPSSVVFERHLLATRQIQPDDELDLVVWPENGIDVDDQPFAGSSAERAVAEEAARLGVPFAVGVTVDSEYSDHPTDGGFVNAQVVVTPDGRVVSDYEKVQIVPFGEYVPLRGLLEAFGAPVDQIASDAIRGQGPAIIELPDGTRLGVMISWEVFFGDRGRAAADGAILLNPTNGASYTGSILQSQQVASSRLRATETGRWVVQVSPTGFSAFVSPDGDVEQRTAVSEQRVIRREVPLRTGTTWYTRLGDVPWTVAVILSLAVSALLAERSRRQWDDRRRRSETDHEPSDDDDGGDGGDGGQPAGSNQRLSSSST